MPQMKHQVICESISGAPPITFVFNGDVVTAILDGARLRAEDEGQHGISMAVHDEDDVLLAAITLHGRPHRTTTENVVDIGSALLWSHWRWRQAAQEQTRAAHEVVCRAEPENTR